MSKTHECRANCEILIYTAILLVSAATRFYAISRSSYGNDELASLNIAMASTWASVLWDNSPPLYHTILRLWVSVMGTGELETRGLSAIFSILTTDFLMRIGLEERGRRTAAIIGSFHALSHLSILFAQETRMYALFELAVAVQLLYFLRLRRSDGRASAWPFFWASFFMLCTHYVAVIPLLCECLILGVCWTRQGEAPRAAAVAVARVALLTLVFAAVGFLVMHWPAISWQQLKFELEPNARWPITVVFELMNESWPFFAAFVFISVAAMLVLPRVRREPIVMAGLLSLLPLVLVTLSGLLLGRAVFVTRYFVFLIPPVTVWLGLSIVTLVERYESRGVAMRLTGAFILVPFALSVESLPMTYVPRKEDWRAAAMIAAEQGARVVLTRSRPYVYMPYFWSKSIKVESLTGDDILPELTALAAREKTICLIDYYTNGAHHEQVRRWAEQVGMHASPMLLETGRYSALMMLVLSRKK